MSCVQPGRCGPLRVQTSQQRQATCMRPGSRRGGGLATSLSCVLWGGPPPKHLKRQLGKWAHPAEGTTHTECHRASSARLTVACVPSFGLTHFPLLSCCLVGIQLGIRSRGAPQTSRKKERAPRGLQGGQGSPKTNQKHWKATEKNPKTQ